MAQYFPKSSSFLRVFHKPEWLKNVLSVVVPSDNFYDFLIWLSLVNMYWNFLCVSLEEVAIFHHFYWICFEMITNNVIIIFKNLNKLNQACRNRVGWGTEAPHRFLVKLTLYQVRMIVKRKKIRKKCKLGQVLQKRLVTLLLSTPCSA